jgi:transcriptional regulator with XRE-family HTH domain
MTDASPYGQILGRNISAARGRLQLRQGDVAARMRELGFPWTQQTAAAVEKARRRPTAEEILGLALALETTISALTGASDQDGLVELPSGDAIGAVSVERLAGRGVNDGSVRWGGASIARLTVLRRLPGVDTFDKELLSQPAWTDRPDKWHPGPGAAE